MDPADDPDFLKTEELTAIIREVRDRVRARYPSPASAPSQMPIPDLMPLVHARDAAQAKVASIGTVNPRRPGAINALIQAIKKVVARALDWHIREQVEFNRNIMTSTEASLEAFNDFNRALIALANQMAALESAAGGLRDLGEWRTIWEQKLAANDLNFQRTAAELESAFQHRATLMESNFRDLTRSQHADFVTALERGCLEIQKKLWSDLDKIRLEYERLIHSELRLLRQRTPLRVPEQPPISPPELPAVQFDYSRFAERFRGSEEFVKERQKFYVPIFAGCREVLDMGCGRGEFLELMREAGVPARGIDLSSESVELCRRKGLQAEVADLLLYLNGLSDCSLDGIFGAHVVEHLPPERLPELIRLSALKLSRGGVLALETPNPECLAIFATHFYLDPTHERPVPAQLLSFYMEEYGIGGIQVYKLSPAVESASALASLPEDFRETFFGGLDYAITGRKLL